MTKLYDLVIRIPVFQTPDGRRLGEVSVTLPSPTPGAPNAVETVLAPTMNDAVKAVRTFAAQNGVAILENSTTLTR